MSTSNVAVTNFSRKAETGLYFYFIFLLGISVGLFGPSLVGLARQTGVTLAEISVLALLLPMAFVIGVYICRYFIHSHSLKMLLVISTLLYGVLFPIVGYSSSFLLVCALFFIVVASEGVFEVASNVLLIRMYKNNPAPYLNAMHFCFGVGAIIAPVLVGLNIEYYDSLTLSFMFFGLLTIPALVALFFIPIKPAVDDAPIVKRTKNSRQLKIVLTIHLFFFLYVLIEAGYSIWIFPFLREEELLNASQAGLFTSAFWLSFTLFRLVGIFLTIYFHPIKVMIWHGVASVIAMLIMMVAGNEIWMLWVGNIVMGAGLSIFFPCMLSYCETGFKIPPKDFSHFFASTTVGAMAGSWFLGQLLLISAGLIFFPLFLAVGLLPILLLYLRHLDRQS